MGAVETIVSAGREMVKEARQELEAAAKRGTEPRLWVAEIMTLAGWECYHKIMQAQSDP